MSRPSFATRANLDLLDEYYQRWLANPASVDPAWQAFFEGFELGSHSEGESISQTRVVRLINAYRGVGHVLARLDPLSDPPVSHAQLEPEFFGLSRADLDRTFDGSAFMGLGPAKLRDIIGVLRDTYCRTIGFEYDHVEDLRIRRWLRERIEPNRARPNFSREQKIKILRNLCYASLFENFLQARYPGQKRFSLEGGEALIPLLDAFVQKAPAMGVQEFVIGMAHRGRLNVLVNILGKPYERVFAEIEDYFVDDVADGDGDVKYHLGHSNTVNVRGTPVHLSLTPNPSHLESVNPVVEGRVRAKQELFKDTARKRGVPILVHGDAALPGQGQVAETFNMANLAGYTTGGTLHVVVNNQIGFTTNPSDARSTRYCTDVAKIVQAPIFHVNGEDAEAVVFAAELAIEFRQEFGQDVVIDLICYRKYGHNEGDEPTYTQPAMYRKIHGRPTPARIYTQQLIADAVLTQTEADTIDAEFSEKLNSAQSDLKKSPRRKRGMDLYDSPRWKQFRFEYSHQAVATGVPFDRLAQIAESLTRVPNGFAFHEKLIKNVIEPQKQSVLKRDAVNWGTAESLAFGSLLLEGHGVRLSGQDVRRGTFSQRHSSYVDVNDGVTRYEPLDHIAEGQARFQVWDSPLSEYAVLGFEYGYSLDDPDSLVLWEAQFGDFCNSAQVIIDQYIASSETKWNRCSGVVLLLPHGYEGQGPEHSSARLERFLHLSAENNIQVCNCTTPAQYFHLLRRQIHRNFRKPLVVMTPKSLLRHPAARSPVEELTTGHFLEVLDDPRAEPSKVGRVFLCSGKVYYDFVWDAKEKKPKTLPSDVAIVRMEQLYPFPEEQLKAVLARYPRAHRWVWVQEEPQNMGAWFFVEPRLRELLRDRNRKASDKDCELGYVCRDASASPATGSYQIHDREQRELIDAALNNLVPYLVRAVPPTVEKSTDRTTGATDAR